ncbi:protoporphyrinogen oxidase [Mangrovibacillus cuniculi]|uniref:Coproporphyrinogen III oxidase n=1 Tax=Mangrovibacillus cuniculi TaxID=2593652 RepID=A0A7S8C9P1_9BACI|nr:protoporphyrinogen oxidase [Mangrovibacillus cuniculi]QPC46006.1 protoporphyrinogen oxidase [Mangrovibacillus cuniculi]
MEEKKRIVIIGGGLTGLTAAYYAQQEASANTEVLLVEASHRLGGKIETVNQNGFLIERGPDSYIARKESMTVLAKELGMEDQLVRNSATKSYVLVNKQLHPIPEGAVMGVPTEWRPFITSGLFSLPGKMRAAYDLFLPKTATGADISIGQFFRRRLGDEVVENLIEPLLSGIYAGKIDDISLQATFPQFMKMEERERSLIKGLNKTRANVPKNAPKKGQFLTFKNGLESFIDELSSRLKEESVYRRTKVVDLERMGQRYKLKLSNDETMEADAVISTLPQQALHTLFPTVTSLKEWKETPSGSVATVAMGFKAENVQVPFDGTGFVVSRKSDYSIKACTWTDKKWPHSTPEGHVMLRCFVGKPGHEAIVDLSDDQIQQAVLEDLKDILGIEAKPLFTNVTRWKKAMPQYQVGHKQKVQRLEAELKAKWPGVWITGSSFGGVGLPDCIDQGKKAALEAVNMVEETGE